MDFKQQVQALAALNSGSLSIHLDIYGSWFINIGVDIKEGEGGCLRSSNGEHGATPELAVANAFTYLTNLPKQEYLVKNSNDLDKRRAYRWNGFMWAEVYEDAIEKAKKEKNNGN